MAIERMIHMMSFERISSLLILRAITGDHPLGPPQKTIKLGGKACENPTERSEEIPALFRLQAVRKFQKTRVFTYH